MRMPKILLLTLLALVACKRQSATPSGTRSVRHVTLEGHEREFIVHTPKNVASPAPVVFMLHGTSGDGQKFYAISGWVEKANAEGFIAVFPSSLVYCVGDDENIDGIIQPKEWAVTSKWASGHIGAPEAPLCDDAQLAQMPRRGEVQSRVAVDDVAFMDAIIANLKSTHTIDEKRLYVSGFSNGGQMVARLMVERSKTFAAFAIAAGNMAQSITGNAERPPPVFFSVGSMDPRLLSLTGLSELPLDFSSVQQMRSLMTKLTTAAQLDPATYTYEATTSAGVNVGVTRYERSTAGASNTLQAMIIDDLEHAYPNGENSPVKMTEVLWPFFSAAALP